MGRKVLNTLVICAVIAGSWYLHRAAGLGMPLPWADECLFVFPALNLTEYQTLFSPQLNPERHLMWMPPGYSFVLAAAFEFFPYSLTLARDLSWLFVVILFFGLLRVMKAAAPDWIVVGIASAFLLATNFTVAGNTARMDGLLLCCATWGWYWATQKNPYFGIALLLTSTLIHPYGLYYLFAALLYIVFVRRKSLANPTRREIMALAAATLLIGAYLIYVLQHQAEFVEDMRFQFVRKGSRDILERLRNDTTMIWLVAGYVLAFATALRFSRKRMAVLIFGAIALAVQVFGLEMWYHIYVAVAALVLFVVLMGFVSDWCDRVSARPTIRYGTYGLVLVSLLAWSFLRGFVASPKRYPDKLSWLGMQMDPGGEYLSSNERIELVHQLNTLADTHPGTRVAFDPEGDALAVWRNDDCRFVPYYPMFTNTKPDIVVIHATEFLPAWWKRKEAMMRWGVEETDLFLQSDDGDRWYIKQIRN